MTIMEQIKQILYSLSMLPGICMSCKWISFLGKRGRIIIPMIGYIITCMGSMIFHATAALRMDPRWLHLDLLGQNIGLMCGISQTVLGQTSPLILFPAASVSFIADVKNEKEKLVAYIANGLNILLTCMFSKQLCLYWAIAFCSFLIGTVRSMYGIWHLFWHAMCHITINDFFKHVYMFKVGVASGSGTRMEAQD